MTKYCCCACCCAREAYEQGLKKAKQIATQPVSLDTVQQRLEEELAKARER